MKLEPETLFVGVIDFFSVLLPGAVLTLLLKDKAMAELSRAGFPEIHGNTAGWATFLFSSYLLRHFIFLVGSKLDDWIYKRIRDATKTRKGKHPWASTKWLAKKFFPKAPDLALEKASPIKDRYLPDEEEKMVVNTFHWAKAMLAIHCPGALVEVQRLEANSRFNSLPSCSIN